VEGARIAQGVGARPPDRAGRTEHRRKVLAAHHGLSREERREPEVVRAPHRPPRRLPAEACDRQLRGRLGLDELIEAVAHVRGIAQWTVGHQLRDAGEALAQRIHPRQRVHGHARHGRLIVRQRRLAQERHVRAVMHRNLGDGGVVGADHHEREQAAVPRRGNRVDERRQPAHHTDVLAWQPLRARARGNHRQRLPWLVVQRLEIPLEIARIRHDGTAADMPRTDVIGGGVEE
jgi:hypothetical protein